ncbi:MAG: hypothetical protein JO227_17470 [Acetobacteraceae bacterium]|nr:hypothetical protein [Acetobacteraceae bacterium]
MIFVFDTLGYAQRLRDAGVRQQQAEAHAEAARDFIMTELATRADLEALRRELQSGMDRFEARLEAKIAALDMKLNTAVEALGARIDTLSLRLTVRLGGMLTAAVAILAAIIKF